MKNTFMVKCIALVLIVMLSVSFTSVYASITYSRGVNMAGPEFNSGTLPGVPETNFTWNNDASYNYFAGKGLTTIRVPILWERIQPTLNTALYATYLNGLKNNITWAKNHGAKVIIDVHNYGRYRGGVIGVDANVPIFSFTDLWVKLSNEFKNETGVYAYDLMNEPHGMGTGTSDWKVISQTALTAIRNNGDNKLIMVEGTYYANAHNWETKNNAPTGWITDPSNNFMYSAHCYFDGDASGTYQSTYDQELASNPELPMIGATRVMDFANWCSKNNVRGFIGEFGIPNNDVRWNTVLENFLDVLDAYGMDGTYWAGGTWWGTYPLSCQPTNNYTTDAQQMSVLTSHLAGTVSATPPPIAGINEAESLTVNVTNKSHTVTSNIKASGGYYDLLNAGAANDYIEYKVNVAQTGTYKVKIRVLRFNNSGTYQLKIDGVNQGSTFDEYFTYGDYKIFDLGNVTFNTTGDKLFRLTCTGKNASATGYKSPTDYIQLEPVATQPSIREAENLTVNATNKSHTISNSTQASGGQYDLLNAGAVNDYIEYKLNVVQTGTYNVTVRVMKYSNNGTYQLKIDGTNLGSAFDTYQTSGYYKDYNLGTVTFNSTGDKLFRFTCTGKNASASGYKLPTDYIVLTKQ